MLVAFALGYPIESDVYNLTIIVFPILYWCANEKDNKVIPILGTLLITMKSFLVITNYPVLITLQAILNPIIELFIIFYILVYRRKEIKGVISNIKFYYETKTGRLHS